MIPMHRATLESESCVPAPGQWELRRRCQTVELATSARTQMCTPSKLGEVGVQSNAMLIKHMELFRERIQFGMIIFKFLVDVCVS